MSCRRASPDTRSRLARTLDEAARRWPEPADDRKALLLRVLVVGARAMAAESAERPGSASDRRLLVTRRLPDLVDVDALVADEAGR